MEIETARANTGVLHCVQDDDVKQTAARAERAGRKNLSLVVFD
jgi:hypothetical protein